MKRLEQDELMRLLLVIPLAIALCSAGGIALCAALQWNPHLREMLGAAAVVLVASAAAAVVLVLASHQAQATIAQAALVGMSLHLFAALTLGGVVYATAFAPRTPFVYWLLVDYWATLPVIAAAFIRALRWAPVQTTGS